MCESKVTLDDRFQGSLLGLALGDAIGATVEFCPRGSFAELTTIVGGGAHNLKAGQWTDDTSMAICLAESLISCNEFNAYDQMTRYYNWWKSGYNSSTGVCFDIGLTVKNALIKFNNTKNPYSVNISSHSAGNGSIMRLAPIALYFYPSLEQTLEFAAASSRTTHAAPEAIESCQLLGYIIHRALNGDSKKDVLDASKQIFNESKVVDLALGKYQLKKINEIKGSGYVINSLEAALWCFYKSTSYREAVLMAANLGDDADTTAAITGQLAGAYYGLDGIPKHWQDILYKGKEIKEIALKLLH